MPYTVSLNFSRTKPNASAKPLDTSRGLAVIAETQKLIQDPDITPEQVEKRQAWLGGAIKMYAALTGMDEQEATNKFSVKRQAAVNNRYADLLMPGATIEPRQ